MSICDFGIRSKTSGANIFIQINDSHPIIKLENFINWSELFELVLPDLKATTKKCKWWLGRKLKVRIHLAIFILQQMFNKTDRQIEYDVQDNAAYGLFCGKNIMDKWHCPDHTKIEEFRSRISPETQRAIANYMCNAAVSAGFANPNHVDIDSTIQEANITYPSEAKMLAKLAGLSKKVADYIDKNIKDFFLIGKIGSYSVNIKEIRSLYRDYVFTAKKDNSNIKKYKLRNLLTSVTSPLCNAFATCEKLLRWGPELPWNIQKTVQQIIDVGMPYFDNLAQKILLGSDKYNDRFSLHASDVACFSKGKAHKKYEFGRAFQLARIAGNFVFALPSSDIRMDDKQAIKKLIIEHKNLFGDKKLHTASADKGYYSSANEELLIEYGVKEVGIIRPNKIKKNKLHTPDIIEKLQSRRSGIEPIIGHMKHGGQLGRSRMKKDQTTLAAGYSSVLGFNLRQIVRYQRLRRKPRYDQIASCQKIYSELRRLFNRPRAPCVRFATTNGFSQHMIYPAGSCG